MALPFIAYLLGCLVVGVILTILVSMFRSTKTIDDFKSWRWIAAFSVLAGLVPYGWCEYLTRKWGDEMLKPVKTALGDAEVAGDLIYFRVLEASESKAKVVAVAKEKGTFATPERTVLTINLATKNGKWYAEEYEFVNSFKRSKDGNTMPPFW